jgi:hypothetical protein
MSDIERAAAQYRELHAGNLEAALRAAVADLLDVQDEAEIRLQVLQHWVSHGYVQGDAGEVLAAIERRKYER